MARYLYRDRFYRKAHQLGLPSRAAFKLAELIERFKLVQPGAQVVDLGCAPGGWLAILSDAVGRHGRVVGVDLASCTATAPHIITIAGDIFQPEVRKAVADALACAADLVTCDLAPRLSGIAARDQALAHELAVAALACARGLLRPGGTMVAKIFMGSQFGDTRSLFEADFASVVVIRTRASRPGSSELYVVARGFRDGSGRHL